MFTPKQMFLFLAALPSILNAQNISIEDYRIPESKYSKLIGNLSGSFGENRNGSSFNKNTQDGWSNELNFGFDNAFGFNSEDVGYNFNSMMNVTTSNGQTKQYDQISTVLKSENQSRRIDIAAYGLYSKYIEPDKFYVFSGFNSHGSYYYYKNSNETNGDEIYNYFSKQRNYNIGINAGTGYGKTRNASSIFVVVRILEKLQEDGYLSRELSKEEILRLVEKYSQRIMFNNQNDRPEKYLLKEIFDELTAMKVLTNQNALAYATSRVGEVFNEKIIDRFMGWGVGIGIELIRN